MPTLRDSTKRKRVLTDFYEYFGELEPLAQQGVIEALEVQMELSDRARKREEAKAAAAAAKPSASATPMPSLDAPATDGQGGAV